MAEHVANLGDDDHLVPAQLLGPDEIVQGRAHGALRGPVGVVGRHVYEVAASLQRQPQRILLVGLLLQAVAAEPQGRDAQAGATELRREEAAPQPRLGVPSRALRGGPIRVRSEVHGRLALRDVGVVVVVVGVAKLDFQRHAVRPVICNDNPYVTVLQDAGLRPPQPDAVAHSGAHCGRRRRPPARGRRRQVGHHVRVGAGLEAAVREALGSRGHGLVGAGVRALRAAPLEHRSSAALGSVQRSAPARGVVIDVGPCVAQQLHNTVMAVVGSEDQRREIVLVRFVRARACCEHRLGNLHRATAHRVVQERGALVGADLGVGPVGHEFADDCGVAAARGHDERRGAVVRHVGVRGDAGLQGLPQVRDHAPAAVLVDIVARLHRLALVLLRRRGAPALPSN
mmetsp:Transcript_103253/g.274597  ORF Transcript_103253/g.274597 Transcript_103253/m.274597 type:complete len:399 (+) Transcript_103253:1009-2205(+)